jgi:DNA-binding response OmpR family regulator
LRQLLPLKGELDSSRRGALMTGTIKPAISYFSQPQSEPTTNSAHFLEDMVSIPAAGIPDEFRKMSRFLPVIVLIPKSAVHDKAAPKKPLTNKFVACPGATSDISSPLQAAKAWFKNPAAIDTFVFGEVTVCFPAMETHRKGKSVGLTAMEFKTLKYLIQNARRVISRDELLNQVWGYENYPCTRTVDNHILRLRQKLERHPSRPAHFRTVHGTGYKFLP